MFCYKDVLNHRFSVFLFAIAVLFATSSPAFASPPPNFALEEVMTGVDQPLSLRFFPDGRMLLLLKKGRMRIVDVSSLPAQSLEYANLNRGADDVNNVAERGLIDVALDPNFPAEPYIYVLYTPDLTERLRVSRFTHEENNGGLTSRGDLNSEVVLWQDTDGYDSCCHYAGSVNFGPEGRLWITTGDHFQGTYAASLEHAGGKVHRINKDGSIPADNPVDDGVGPNVDSVVAKGLRNPFRARWDLNFAPGKARFFIAEVGGNEQSIAWEDLHVIDYDYASGRFVDNDFGGAGDNGIFDLINFGWPTVEGLPPHTDFSAPDIDAVGEPVFAYKHAGNLSSITGGPVYRGSQFPAEFDGAYFYSESTRSFVRYVKFNPDGTVAPNPNPDPISEQNPDSISYMFDPAPVGRVVALELSPDGALYYLSLTDGFLDSNPTVKGAVRRYVYDSGNSRPQISSFSADPTSGPDPLMVDFVFEATDPEGDPMTYVLDFDDGTMPIGPLPLVAGVPTMVSHEYLSGGAFDPILQVSDASRTASATESVQVGIAPVVDSLTSANTTWDGRVPAPDYFQFGDVITFAATAVDGNGNPIHSDNFEWSVDFIRPGSTHPAYGPETGGASIDFPIPRQGQGFSGPVFYRCTLKVTDPSNGLSTIQTLDVFPEKVDITLDAVPSGIVVQVDGNTAKETPFVLDTLINIDHIISVPSTTCFGGMQYDFVDWSNGRTEPVINNPQFNVPDFDMALTANFVLVGACAGPPEDGLVMHLRSTDGLTVDGSSAVQSWADQTVNGNGLTASGAPTVVTAGLNGMDVIHFDGNDDAMGRGGFTGLPTGSAARSVFIVVRYNQADASTGGWVGFAYGSVAKNQVFGLALTPDGTLGVQGWGGANDVESSPPTNGVGEWLSQTAIYQGGTLSQYKNGVSIGTVSHTFATGTGGIRLGEEINLDKNLDMDVAEVLVYDRALSESDRLGVESYLEQHYSLSSGGENPPELVINSPTHNQIVDPSEMPITLAVTATDDDGSDLSNSVNWLSSIDGPLWVAARQLTYC